MRGHAVKHFCDHQQINDLWKSIMSFSNHDLQKIEVIKTQLDQLRCPILNDTRDRYSSRFCKKCQDYAGDCDETDVAFLEKQYYFAAMKIVSVCLKVPRYVTYARGGVLKKLDGAIKVKQPNNKAVVFGSVELPDRSAIYNVSTVFVTSKSFEDWLVVFDDKLKIEGLTAPPEWKTSGTWGRIAKPWS